MAMSPRLDLRQGQSLVMTPQLQQSIKLLQLSNLELAEYVAEELESNPLLERKDAGPEVGFSDEGGQPLANGGEPMASDQALAKSEDMPEGRDLADIDVSTDDVWRGEDNADVGPGISMMGSGRTAREAPTDLSIDQAPAAPETLRDHLLEQLGVECADPADRLIGSHLIEMLDEAGYLSGELALVAEALGCPTERVEHTLETLQSFDPSGVFARDLAECLALQLKDKDRYDPAMAALVENLDLLAKGDIERLMTLTGVDEEDFTDMVAELKRLNPKPGLAFDSELVQPVVPDVFVRPRPGGGWSIELNTETLPRVMVNTRYCNELNDQARGGDRAFISECLRNANWLVRSLDQRARTILKVATELVRQQEPFFTRGVQHLRPLTLRDVADAIEMHESTVSRVSSNKFVATPRGIYEMRFFFSGGLSSTSGGETHAAQAVRDKIRELIENEPSDCTLSDDQVAERLAESGVRIARRTVAKYREAMHIPSSVQRRRKRARAAYGL